ncbi:uncharacterized protein [Amphiura filiformis]|uniref:uncharacterized protein n=1 Tax=Amphiura filiformis TaxID=82378 RepID=UPI003B211BAB
MQIMEMSRLFYTAKLCGPLLVLFVITLQSVSSVPINANRDYHAQNLLQPQPGRQNGQQQYLPNSQFDTGAYNPADYTATQNQHNFGNPAMAGNNNQMDYYNGGDNAGNTGFAGYTGNTADYMVDSGQTQGFKSPAKFETLLTEDNTNDYMNYNNHYDINVIHSQDDDRGRSHEHEYKGNGIEKDVGTRDKVAHDPIELEAVAMRAIGHQHDDNTEYHGSHFEIPEDNVDNTLEAGHWNQYGNPYEAPAPVGLAPEPVPWQAPGPAQWPAPEPAQWSAPGSAPGPAQWPAPEPAQWSAPGPAQWSAQPAQWSAPGPAPGPAQWPASGPAPGPAAEPAPNQPYDPALYYQ